MELHYEVTGQGARTIVLTHGLAASGGVWGAQVHAFAKGFRVLTWDLRGHGQSISPKGSFTLHDLSEDLRAVLDHAGIEEAVVLGHSAGGVIAMRFALDHPDRVAGLVLVGTASECNQRSADFYEKLATIALERGMEPAQRRLGVSADAARNADPATFAMMARCMGNLLNQPLTSEVELIQCPTLIIVGDKDLLGAGGSVILSRRIRGSRLHIVPGRGHGIFLEDPDGFNAMVASFLRNLPPPTAVSSDRNG